MFSINKINFKNFCITYFKTVINLIPHFLIFTSEDSQEGAKRQKSSRQVCPAVGQYYGRR